jgi:hypothetical protein
MHIDDNSLRWSKAHGMPTAHCPLLNAHCSSILPSANGLWKEKDKREPRNTGNGHTRGFIHKPTGDGGWAFNEGELISFCC